MKKNEENNSSDTVKISVSIGEQLKKKINKHINLLNEPRDRHKKILNQEWLSSAIQTYLDEQDINSIISPSLSYLTFQVPNELKNRLDDRVELIRKDKSTYSKKKLIVEAVQRKIEKEEKITAEIEKRISEVVSSFN